MPHSVKYDLKRLSKYSYKAKLYYGFSKKRNAEDLSVVLHPCGGEYQDTDLTPTLQKSLEIKEILKNDYGEALAETHWPNLYLLLMECCLEVETAEVNNQQIIDATEIFEFLRKLTIIKKANKSSAKLTVSDGKNPSATIQLNKLNPDFNIIDELIYHGLRQRLRNEVLFNYFEPQDLNNEVKVEPLPDIVRSKRFQLAHHCFIILDYLNVELEGINGRTPKSFTLKQLRLIFWLLRVVGITDILITDSEIETLFPKKVNAFISKRMKDFLESHRDSKNSSYRVSVKKLAEL